MQSLRGSPLAVSRGGVASSAAGRVAPSADGGRFRVGCSRWPAVGSGAAGSFADADEPALSRRGRATAGIGCARLAEIQRPRNRRAAVAWSALDTRPGSAPGNAPDLSPEKAAEDGAAEVVIPEKSVSVILLAGGKGKRMGATMPKQYLPLLGQPIALHSFHTFASMPQVAEIVVVCDPSYRDIFEETKTGVSLKFALPGKERQDSVRSGLQEISKSSKLACIHDSARPLVLEEDILKVVKDAWRTGAAVLGVPVKATIKEAGDGGFVTKTLDRETLWEMQTPQVIEPQLLRKGFELVEREGYEVTDDVSIVEYLKHPVLITKGSYSNLKVTTPDDLVVAERILHQSTPAAMAAFSAAPVVV